MKRAYFEDGRLNYAPTIEAVVKGPKGVKLLADTGFQGGVLVPLMTYVELGLNLVEEPKAVARTATGAKVELRSARAVLEIGNMEIPCKAYTALGVTMSEERCLKRWVCSTNRLMNWS